MLSQLKEEVTPLLRGIVTDTQTLIRQEVALARREVRQIEGRHPGRRRFCRRCRGGDHGRTAAVPGPGRLHQLVFPGIPLWGSLLAVGLGLGIAAAALLTNSRREARELDLAPQQTINSLKENAKWIARTN